MACLNYWTRNEAFALIMKTPVNLILIEISVLLTGVRSWGILQLA